MKTAAIAKKYDLRQFDFENFLKRTGSYTTSKLTLEMIVEDSKVEQVVERYKNYIVEQEEDRLAEQRQKELELKQKQEFEAARAKALPKILVTSGFNFEGYRIVKYSGYISGDDAVQINRGFSGWLTDTTTNVGSELMKSLTVIRRNALKELKEAAYDLDCNAIIGVDFDYLTLDPQTANASGGTTYLPYVFGVTANGTAVVIEKIED